jgi:superfamily II DNA/RNA helicase
MSTTQTSNSEMDTYDEIKEYNTFDSMGVNDELLRGIYSIGFDVPSSIQKKAIVPIINKRDVIAQSQSGTGKTGAFTIGSLALCDASIKNPQIIILSPTRELAQQIETVAKGLTKFNNIIVHSATGGPPIAEDMRALQRGVQFIVGTPGRIYDLIRRGSLKLDNIRALILDEADQMLEDRFREQVKCILNFKFPSTTQLLLFSATMPDEVTEVAEKFLRNPVRILMPPENVTLAGIKQYYVNVERDDWKFEVLLDLYEHLTINQLIIFVNKRQRAEWLAQKMHEKGFTLEYIHGEMDVAERKSRMADFRRGQVRVLISTDLLARGIDVQQVSLVINYELPIQHENYIHRIGRSGRYGRKGVAINLLMNDEMNSLKEIETHYSTVIDPLPTDLNNIGI